MFVSALLFLTAFQPPANWCEAPRPAALAKLEQIPAVDSWFEVFRLDSKTYVIRETRQEERVMSYLILGDKRALLFDTGFGIGRIEKEVAALTRLPVTVLNSHSHYDHIGGNSGFNEILGFDSAYSRGHESGMTNASAARFIATGSYCPPLPAGVTPENYSIPPYKVSRYIRDGETIDLGGRQLEVLFTPGHSPDSLCLLDRAGRTLFTGDTFYPGTLWLWVPETDLKAYRKSLERLVQLVPSLDRLLTAHGLPEADPKVLPKVLEALGQVENGTAKFEERNGRRRYRFDGFSMLLSSPK